MIGIMNSGDQSVEFYSSPRTTSLYQGRVKKSSRTYTPEGRVFVDGVPVYTESAEKMWQDVISKILAMKMMKEMESKESGVTAAIRRLSSKLRLRKANSIPSERETMILADLHRETRLKSVRLSYIAEITPSTPPSPPTIERAPPPTYVTTIEINPEMLLNSDSQNKELRFEEESLLVELLKERERVYAFERKQRDSGRGSMENGESPDDLMQPEVIVERF